MSELEEFMPYFNQAVMAGAMSASSIHTGRKFILEIVGTIKRLSEHESIRGNKDLSNLVKKVEHETSELINVFDRLNDVFMGNELILKSCDLTVLMQEIQLYMMPMLKENRVSLKYVDPDSSLPDIKVDPTLMKIVFFNLIDNIIKAGAREISIGATSKEVNRAGFRQTAVEVSLMDDRTEISRAELEKLFDFRMDKKGKLGLFICKYILDKHGGIIEVESNVKNQRTKISLVLPV